MDQRPQYKPIHTEPQEEKVGNTLECISTGNHFLKRTPLKTNDFLNCENYPGRKLGQVVNKSMDSQKHKSI